MENILARVDLLLPSVFESKEIVKVVLVLHLFKLGVVSVYLHKCRHWLLYWIDSCLFGNPLMALIFQVCIVRIGVPRQRDLLYVIGRSVVSMKHTLVKSNGLITQCNLCLAIILVQHIMRMVLFVKVNLSACKVLKHLVLEEVCFGR